MTIDYFWWVIERLGWADEIRKGTKRPYEVCGTRLVQFLPDKEGQLEFDAHYRTIVRKLRTRLDAWEDERSSRRFPLGDDSYGDLIAMIVGLGKAEYDRVMENPSLAWERSNRPYGSVDSYVESFSYMFQYIPNFTEHSMKRQQEVLKKIQKLQAKKAKLDEEIKALQNSIF